VPCLAAAEPADAGVSFSGFGTLAAVRTDTDAGQYATSVLQPQGARRSWDARPDSLLAGQVTARFTRDLGFVGQVVANRRAQDDFMPHVEWAFVRYALTPDVAVRGGIMAVPILMLSDSRLVGISFPWVRPPTAVYSQVPITNFRGADVVYRKSFGDTVLTLQPYLGKAPTDVPSSTGPVVRTDLDKVVGLAASAALSEWTVRAAYFQCDLTYPGQTAASYVARLREIAPTVAGAGDLASRIDPTHKRLSYVTVGAAYDDGTLLAQAEIGRLGSKTLMLAETTSWYATLGYRFANVMPHVTVSRTRVTSPLTQDVLSADGAFADLASGIDSILATSNVSQRVVAIGARWQFMRNADLKVQWDRVRLPDGAVGNFNASPGFARSVNVYSAALDFVF
jgi:hypothetical protein